LFVKIDLETHFEAMNIGYNDETKDDDVDQQCEECRVT
jgi:hypothetical protein